MELINSRGIQNSKPKLIKASYKVLDGLRNRDGGVIVQVIIIINNTLLIHLIQITLLIYRT